jgi:hypothetical protein
MLFFERKTGEETVRITHRAINPIRIPMFSFTNCTTVRVEILFNLESFISAVFFFIRVNPPPVSFNWYGK